MRPLVSGFPNGFDCSLTQPVHHQVLEVPKAPSEMPERDYGFLGVVERLRQVFGVMKVSIDASYPFPYTRMRAALRKC